MCLQAFYGLRCDKAFRYKFCNTEVKDHYQRVRVLVEVNFMEGYSVFNNEVIGYVYLVHSEHAEIHV